MTDSGEGQDMYLIWRFHYAAVAAVFKLSLSLFSLSLSLSFLSFSSSSSYVVLSLSIFWRSSTTMIMQSHHHEEKISNEWEREKIFLCNFFLRNSLSSLNKTKIGRARERERERERDEIYITLREKLGKNSKGFCQKNMRILGIPIFCTINSSGSCLE